MSIDDTATMDLNQVVDVSQYTRAVFVVRTYSVGVSGTMSIRTSNQNVDSASALWWPVTENAAISSGNKILVIAAPEAELLSFARWEFTNTGGSGATTFEITAFGYN